MDQIQCDISRQLRGDSLPRSAAAKLKIAIKRPRTRSTAARQVSNAHERGARTGETYDWRAAAPTLLSSCSPLPAACSAKTSYPASHPHNTTPLHATTPHSHLPLYSHPPTPTPSNTPFFFAQLLTLGYAFASS